MINSFDFFSFIIVAAMTYFGFKIKVSGGLFYVVVFLLGMWVAQNLAANPGISDYLVFLSGAVMGAISVILFIILVKRRLNEAIPENVNSYAGAVLGFLLGFVFIGTVLLPVTSRSSESSQEKVFASFTASYIMPWSQELFPGIQQSVVEKTLDIVNSLDNDKSVK